MLQFVKYEPIFLLMAPQFKQVFVFVSVRKLSIQNLTKPHPSWLPGKSK